MLNEIEITPGMYVVIESDNCTSQYKSAKSCYDMQEQANKYNVNLIRLYGIAGHGKGEVDHVGGVAKISIHEEIASGKPTTRCHRPHIWLNSSRQNFVVKRTHHTMSRRLMSLKLKLYEQK